jgi:hypothetical protein
MDPLVGLGLRYGAKRFIEWWDKKRPFSPAKRENRRRKRMGLDPLPIGQEAPMLELLKKILAEKRTSTKSGLAGIIIPWLLALAAALPFYGPISEYVVEACRQPKPLDFLLTGAAAWAITWFSMFITARRSITPPNPGKL